MEILEFGGGIPIKEVKLRRKYHYFHPCLWSAIWWHNLNFHSIHLFLPHFPEKNNKTHPSFLSFFFPLHSQGCCRRQLRECCHWDHCPLLQATIKGVLPLRLVTSAPPSNRYSSAWTPRWSEGDVLGDGVLDIVARVVLFTLKVHHVHVLIEDRLLGTRLGNHPPLVWVSAVLEKQVHDPTAVSVLAPLCRHFKHFAVAACGDVHVGAPFEQQGHHVKIAPPHSNEQRVLPSGFLTSFGDDFGVYWRAEACEGVARSE